MTTEDNKALVLRACAYLSERRLDELYSLIDDMGSWSVPYRTDKFAYAGFRDKPAFAAMLTGFLGGFTEFSFTVTSITAEGDQVAVEAESAGMGPGAAVYKNIYSLTFFIKDGKLHTVRELFDPFEVLDYVSQIPA